MGTMPEAGPGPAGWPSQTLSSPFNPPTHHVRERSDPRFVFLGDFNRPPEVVWGRLKSGRGGMPRPIRAQCPGRTERPRCRHDTARRTGRGAIAGDVRAASQA
jgi:hypothetical protein